MVRVWHSRRASVPSWPRSCGHRKRGLSGHQDPLERRGLVVTRPNRDVTVNPPCHHGPLPGGISHPWLADKMSWQVSSERDWNPRQESLLFPGSSALRWSKSSVRDGDKWPERILEKGHTLSDQALGAQD